MFFMRIVVQLIERMYMRYSICNNKKAACNFEPLQVICRDYGSCTSSENIDICFADAGFGRDKWFYGH